MPTGIQQSQDKDGDGKGKEMVYLTTCSTHFLYGYMALDKTDFLNANFSVYI